LKDVCFNGESPLDLEERLKAFKKGMCSPAILVPGILGTALVVEIDCVKLKAWENGTVFKDCGWDTCQDFVGKKPAKSYMLWVGVELMAKPLFGPRKCFGDLLGLRYNIS
jgi:lecithin-cholesterol acyltransferase